MATMIYAGKGPSQSVYQDNNGQYFGNVENMKSIGINPVKVEDASRQNGFVDRYINGNSSNQIGSSSNVASSAQQAAAGLSTNAGVAHAFQSVANGSSDYSALVDAVLGYSDAATAKSQEFAREQMQYQTDSDKKAMAWSAEQAQIDRDWQEKMSSTAVQRQMADFKAAGLNPVLAASYGGASSGSGAMGQSFSSSGASGSVDSSGMQFLSGLMSALIAANTQIATASMNAGVQRDSIDAQVRMNENTNSTNMAMNELNNATSTANAKLSSETSENVAKINGEYNTNIANINGDVQKYLKENYPSNMVQAASSYVKQLVEAGENQQSIVSKVDAFLSNKYKDWGQLKSSLEYSIRNGNALQKAEARARLKTMYVTYGNTPEIYDKMSPWLKSKGFDPLGRG